MKVKVQQGREEINSIGGISFIGGLFNSLKSLKKVDSMRMNKVKTGKIKHSGILKTITGLFGIGKNDYAGACFTFCEPENREFRSSWSYFGFFVIFAGLPVNLQRRMKSSSNSAVTWFEEFKIWYA